MGNLKEIEIIKKKTKHPHQNSGFEEYSEWNKNAVVNINSRLDQTEERICDIDDMSFEMIQSEENKEKNEKE